RSRRALGDERETAGRRRQRRMSGSDRLKLRCAGVLLRGEALIEGPAEMRQRGVGPNRQKLIVRVGVEYLLLGLDDRLVLEETFLEAVAQRQRDIGIVDVEIVQIVPEEVGGAARLRRHELGIAVLPGTFDRNAFFGALACRREHRIEQEDAGNDHAPDIAAVDLVALVGDHLSMIGRRIGIHVPAFDAESIVQPFDRDRLGAVGIFLRTAQRVGVDEGEMGKVAEIVDDQQPVGLVVHIAGKAAPGGVVERRIVDDQGRIGLLGLAHPDPDQIVTLDDRIAAHAQLWRDHLLAGNLNAFARRIELHAMVHAADVVALDAAHRQRRRPVAAAVVQRDDPSALAAIQQNRTFQDRARESRAVDQFMIPGRHVPAIPQKDAVCRHDISPIVFGNVFRSVLYCRLGQENPFSLDIPFGWMDNHAMDWRDWDVFCHVVDHGGFTAAARVLGHPKSSLSAAVQRLEADVGLRLLERTTRRLRLTEAGESVYHRVGPLFAALRDARSESMAACGTVAGILRIASPYEFGAHHVGPVACALMASYPNLRVRIDVEHEIVDPIAGNYDMVFAMLEAPLRPSAIVIRKVFSIARGLFAAPSLLESRGEPRTLGDLAGFPLLAGPTDAEWTLTDRHGS